MIQNTINDDVTMDGAGGTLLAGRYRVVKQLGQGGMGSVWLAEDTKLDGLRVAIKMLPSILVNNKRAYAQVKAEALVSLKLSHPNIVTVRAFEEEGGNPFLVMDYIDGQTLDDYLAEHSVATAPAPSRSAGLPEEEVIRLLKPVAAALDYAHTQGVVHRDVKPGNVMIRKDGTPFVLDFGIAREVQETMTRVTGKVSSGTLMYMSPEQLNGDEPKPAQDIYSFAAMAYECLTGAPPFCRGGIEDQIKNKMPELLGPHFMKCGHGVMAGLEKLPENRPATCAAVLTAAAKARSAAKSGSSASKAWLAAVVLGLAVLVGGGLWWQGHVEAEKQRAEAAAERAKAEEARIAAEKAKADAERKAEEQRKAEETRIAAEKANADAERKAEKARIAEEKAKTGTKAVETISNQDADRQRQEEIAKLSKIRVKISIKISSAKSDYEKVAPYRSECDGFESHLAEVDRQWTVFDQIQQPKTLSEAEKTYAALTEAADAIAFELNWLATNRESRDAAKRIEKEIADELDAPLQAFKAYDVVKSAYDKGQDERKAAADALACGEFASARRQYEQAKTTLTRALAEARQFHVKTALAVANEYKAVARWQHCIDEVEKVLGWDPQNAEGLVLKAEAENHLMPTAKVVAKIGEREVIGAILNLGQLTSSLPGVWNTQSLRDGHFFPEDRDYEVTYEENGKAYVGFMRGGRRDVDWQGQKTFVVTLTEHKGPKPGDTKTIQLPGGAAMEMVWCPPGDFLMGSSNRTRATEAQHRVRLTKGFWMGKYEVTRSQWKSVMGELPALNTGWFRSDHPVTGVSWNACQLFIEKINCKGTVCVSLPTEAQWEYACRAGTTTPFNFGSVLNGDRANCDGRYPYGTTETGPHQGDTCPVGSYMPNAWGLYDMHGNVGEWCSDWYAEDYYTHSPRVDPKGPSQGSERVYRGGGWIDIPACCRSASRWKSSPLKTLQTAVGLRLVCF